MQFTFHLSLITRREAPLCYTIDVKTVFLSDVHLRRPHDANYRRMLAFLDDLDGDVERLVVNGDFFDAWFSENRAAERLHQPALTRLAGLVDRGVEVLYLEGNHDIAIGDTLGRYGVSFAGSDWRGEMYGSRVWITHGDRITGDTGYEALYHTLRSPYLAGLNRVVPSALSLRIAMGMSTASRMRSPDVEEQIREKIRRVGRGLRDVDVFVTGHTHVPMDEVVEGPEGPVRVVNLGDWIRNFTWLEAGPAGWRLHYG